MDGEKAAKLQAWLWAHHQDDPEVAHGSEDELLWYVVELLTSGQPAVALAHAAWLASYDKRFPDRVRWYA